MDDGRGLWRPMVGEGDGVDAPGCTRGALAAARGQGRRSREIGRPEFEGFGGREEICQEVDGRMRFR